MTKWMAVVVLATVAPAWAGQEGKPLDPALILGTWDYTSGTKAGEEVPKDRLGGTVKITKEAISLMMGDEESFRIEYTLDAKASPAKLDLKITKSPIGAEGAEAKGRIELIGDTLKLVYKPMADEYPAKLESTGDNGAFLFVLKKAK